MLTGSIANREANSTTASAKTADEVIGRLGTAASQRGVVRREGPIDSGGVISPDEGTRRAWPPCTPIHGYRHTSIHARVQLFQ
eukprot:SAG31_NODE_227_length_19818_cov_6.503271_22_plen_83_part_00